MLLLNQYYNNSIDSKLLESHNQYVKIKVIQITLKNETYSLQLKIDVKLTNHDFAVILIIKQLKINKISLIDIISNLEVVL